MADIIFIVKHLLSEIFYRFLYCH